MTEHAVTIGRGKRPKTGTSWIRAECSCGWKGNDLEVWPMDRRSTVRLLLSRAQQQALAHAKLYADPA